MFLDMVGVITTSKLSILSTFQGGAVSAPPPCQVGLRYIYSITLCQNVKNHIKFDQGKYSRFYVNFEMT